MGVSQEALMSPAHLRNGTPHPRPGRCRKLYRLLGTHLHHRPEIEAERSKKKKEQ